MKNLALILTTIVTIFALSACGTENPFDRGPREADFEDSFGPVTGDISFAQHVVPALNTCRSCHAGGAGGWTYTGGHDQVVSVVNTGNPADSELLIKGTGGDGHGGGSVFSASSNQYQAILAWIQQGALNN